MIHMYAADKIGMKEIKESDAAFYWIFSRNAVSTCYGTPVL